MANIFAKAIAWALPVGAKKFLRGPTSGSNAIPDFDYITGADLPVGTLRYHDVWINSTSYIAGDVVIADFLGGKPFICITPNINSQPPSVNWQILASNPCTAADQQFVSVGTDGAIGPSGFDDISFLKPANNLSDLISPSLARGNLGLGSAATFSSSAFDPIGAAASVTTTSIGAVPIARTLTTSTPLAGGGDLSANRTLTIQIASGSQVGALASADWNTFNNKVSTTRMLNTTAPITGGGDLSADRTLAITTASISVDGYLTATNFVIFNNKAAIASPTFTGTPAAPTATAGTNTTQLATCAFVTTAIAGITVPTAANPTGLIGAFASNGVAATFQRSDATPALDQPYAEASLVFAAAWQGGF